MNWPFPPPLETMEAKVLESWPQGRFAYEPKWDGFRAVSWGGSLPRLDSRNQKPLLRYFPELTAALAGLPNGTVVDGEVVVVIDDVTDFDALQQRIHPAASRVNLLSEQTPAQLVAFDLLALEGEDLRRWPFADRRRRLEQFASGLEHPWNLTPSTTDADLARRWFDEFESAGCDGIIAKPLDQGYVHGKRAMI
ncbi:MAG: ATP-dependent DNA ligase, partial [Acidimicrobiia bacterium]|nr:ATP-dependent DNA ligase [Acidimicrobiia bacterium]